MTKTKWLYFVSANSVARANNPIVIPMFLEIGFHQCSYNEYLAKRKTLKDDETTIEIQGKATQNT